MGLRTTHGAFEGSYTSFNDFRYEVARLVGINLDEYIGFRGDNPTKNLDSITHDLKPLLIHSDCDGELTPKECEVISDALYDILEEKFDDIHDNDMNIMRTIKKFAHGCFNAWFKNEPLKFQ